MAALPGAVLRTGSSGDRFRDANQTEFNAGGGAGDAGRAIRSGPPNASLADHRPSDSRLDGRAKRIPGQDGYALLTSVHPEADR
jgi:hypothetical protein